MLKKQSNQVTPDYEIALASMRDVLALNAEQQP